MKRGEYLIHTTNLPQSVPKKKKKEMLKMLMNK